MTLSKKIVLCFCLIIAEHSNKKQQLGFDQNHIGKMKETKDIERKNRITKEL